MTRDEYLLNALKAGVYRKAAWVFSIFTIVEGMDYQEGSEVEYDYQLFRKDNQYIAFINNQLVTIEGVSTDRPLWLVEEGITINQSDDIVQKTNLTFPFKTRVGSLFLNYYCLVSAFGNKVEYQQGKFSISDLEALVVKRLVDRPADKSQENENDLYPDEVKLFSSACSSTSGFSTIASPSATEYTMLPAPGIKEKRKELLTRYKDKLDDPAIVAMIEKELVAYDKAYQMQDPEGGFLQGAKVFNVSRKKLFVMGGLEMSEITAGKPAFVENSLSEGWDINNLPAMIDTMRSGSYNRGALTALGGEAVKFIFRIFATTSITEEDCGTKVGIPRILSERDRKTYLGNTAILANGTQLKITAENFKDLIGHSIQIRSPGFCKTHGANYCLACLGEQLRGSENALAALASRVGSQMLDIFMAKMHGVALVTTPWKPEYTIS